MTNEQEEMARLRAIITAYQKVVSMYENIADNLISVVRTLDRDPSQFTVRIAEQNRSAAQEHIKKALQDYGYEQS
jgi:hypothetical protein